MNRGMSNPLAHVDTENPCGTCSMAPAGGSTTRGALVADGVAKGAGSCGACAPTSAPPPTRRSITATTRMSPPGVNGDRRLRQKNPNGNDTGDQSENREDHGCSDVDERCADIMAFPHETGIQRKCRKRREAAEDTGCQKQPLSGRGRFTAEREPCGEHSHRHRPRDVRDQL